MAVAGDGRIVAFGKAGGAFALARFNTDGTLDATFSDNGKQTIPAALAGADDVGVDGVLQGDGKPVVVGTTAGGDFALARVHGDPLDPTARSKHTGNADRRRSVRADERDVAVVQLHGDAFGLDV